MLGLLFAYSVDAGTRNSAFDERGDVEGSRAADLRKLSVVRPTDDGLELRILTAGLLSEDERSIEYWIAIDVDNNPETGGSSPEEAIFNLLTISGADLVLLVRVDAPPPECGEVELPVLFGRLSAPVGASGEEAPRPDEAVFAETPDARAVYRTACMVTSVFNSRTNRYEDARVPSVQNLTVELAGHIVEIQNAFRIQIAARDLAASSTDILPADPATFSLGSK